MAKAEPKNELNGRFSVLHNLKTMDTVVMDNDDMYTEENTSLRKSIHEFFAASVEKGKKKYVFWRIRIDYIILKTKKSTKRISYGERSKGPPEPKLVKIVNRNRAAMPRRLNP